MIRPERVLTLIEENQQARAQAQAQGKAKTDERTGMQTTALIVQVGERRICLYYTGRRHAGENLAALLTQAGAGTRQTVGDVGCVEQQQRGGRRRSFAVIVWRMGGASSASWTRSFPPRVRWW